jgi:hypothetical protein
MPLEPLICRSRYGNVKKSYKNRRKFGKSKKTMKLCSVQKTRVLTVPDGTIKLKNYEKRLETNIQMYI